MNDTSFVSTEHLGPPTVTCEEPNGTLQIWSLPPIVITRIQGHGSKVMADELVRHYHGHFEQYNDVITINEWSCMTDYDSESRKIMQQLTREMRSKQKELLIHLGKTDTLIQGVVRTTVKTLMLFHALNIEIYDDNAQFETRATEVLNKYQRDL